MLRGGVRRRIAATCLGTLVLLAPVVVSSVAHGDPIADKQKQAAEIAAKLTGLQHQVEVAANDYELAQQQQIELDQQIASQQAEVEKAKAAQAKSERELTEYAVNAYMSGNAASGLPDLVGTSAGDLGQREGYAAAAMGDRQQLIDNLQAAQKNADDEIADLEEQRAAVETTKAKAAQNKQAAETATAQYEALQKQVKGELARLVAEKQAAEARAAQQRAYQQALAQARAQARARAERSAAAANQAATERAAVVAIPAPPASAGGGGSPSGGGYVAPPPPSGGGSLGARAVAVAATKLGRPYVWGAAGPDSFDCSGLTQWSYAQVGVGLPRTTYQQINAGRRIPISAIAPGDLVFYSGLSHMAMYAGGGQVIEAPHTGDVVKYISLYMAPIDAVVRPY